VSGLANTDPRPDRIGDAWDWLRLIGAAGHQEAGHGALTEAVRAARIMGARLEHGAGTLVMRPPLDCAADEWSAFRERYLLPVGDQLIAALREVAS
jgi:hypothetical protein